MSAADWVVTVLLAVWAIAAAVSMIEQHKKGKCCGCCIRCKEGCGKRSMK